MTLWRQTLCAIPVADAFLDSSVLIGLVFRPVGERAACCAALSSDVRPFCSRYVIFELARGFLRSLIALHNYSFVVRIDGLRHLLAAALGTPFDGKKCHRCGDALICLEAPPGCLIVTKNRKHFEPLVQILGKPLTVAETASSTKGLPPV